MSGPDIFISYSREDRNAARHFAESFAQEGFSVWWDAALHSGETFDEVIENSLKASKAVVVLWSPRSVTSRWVRAEATLADRRNKLAPVIIEACDRPIIFELTHTADLSDWSGEITDPAWRVFVRDLHRLVDKGNSRDAAAASAAKSAPPPKPKPPPEPPSQRFSQRFAEGRRARPPLQTGKVEDLMLALSSLQDAISKTKGLDTPEVDAPEVDESERTQIYRQSDGNDPFETDEFHCLEIHLDGRLAKRYVVAPTGLKIGRTAPADIILADAEVSRSHCRVELAGHQLKVSDLNSTNGTFVDGKRVKGDAMLDVGSLLRVGNVVFKHEIRSRADG